MQRKVGSPDRKFGGTLRQFWGVMQEMSRMLETAHGLDANPGSRSEDRPREWEPRVTEMPAGGDLVLYFELPGVERGEVDLTLCGRQLVVSGFSKELPSFEHVTVEDFISGRLEVGPVRYSPFKSVVELPKAVEEGEVEAVFGAELLQVYVPEIAESRSRRIHVRGGRYPRR